MSLPLDWIEKIFAKMMLVYGHDFLRRWDGMDLDTVKEDWAYELGRFRSNPDAISWGLQNLQPGQPPNVADFRALCARRPDPAAKALPSKKADPEVVRMCLERLRQGGIEMETQAGPDIRWAHRIVDRCRRGENVSAAALRLARSAIDHRSRVA